MDARFVISISNNVALFVASFQFHNTYSVVVQIGREEGDVEIIRLWIGSAYTVQSPRNHTRQTYEETILPIINTTLFHKVLTLKYKESDWRLSPSEDSQNAIGNGERALCYILSGQRSDCLRGLLYVIRFSGAEEGGWLGGREWGA